MACSGFSLPPEVKVDWENEYLVAQQRNIIIAFRIAVICLKVLKEPMGKKNFAALK